MRIVKKYSQEDEKYIRDNYATLGGIACAKHLGRCPICLCQKAARMGIKLSRAEKTNIHIKARIRSDDWYHVNPRQFIDVSSAEAVYLLGYIWADGTVRRAVKKSGAQSYIVILEIATEDYLTIKSIIDKTGAWKIYARKPRKSSPKPITAITTHNKPLVEFLLENDYGIKSAGSPDKILSIIPKHYLHYWWRGYFDGDGTIGFYPHHRSTSFSIAGSYIQDWSAAEAILKTLDIKYSIMLGANSKGYSSSVIKCSNLKGTNAWGEYIYKGFLEENIGLKRKFLKWKAAKLKFDEIIRFSYFNFSEEDKLENEIDLYMLIKRYPQLISFQRLGYFSQHSESHLRYLIRKLKCVGAIKSVGFTQIQSYETVGEDSDNLLKINKMMNRVRARDENGHFYRIPLDIPANSANIES